MTSFGEGKTLNLKCNRSSGMNPDNISCYSLARRHSEGICQQNDRIAKEYWGLTEEHIDVIGRTLLLMLITQWEGKLIISSCFVINGYLASASHWSIIKIIQCVMFVLFKSFSFWSPDADVGFVFWGAKIYDFKKATHYSFQIWLTFCVMNVFTCKNLRIKLTFLTVTLVS